MKPTKMWQHKSCNQSLYHTLFIIGQFTVKQWQKTAAFRGTCRINLRKWKYQFTLESLPKPDNSNSYRTPHCKHRSMVRIYLNGYVTVQHCSASWILDPRSSKLKTRSSRLETQSSHLETRSVWALRRKDQVTSFEVQVSIYFWAVL